MDELEARRRKKRRPRLNDDGTVTFTFRNREGSFTVSADVACQVSPEWADEIREWLRRRQGDG